MRKILLLGLLSSSLFSLGQTIYSENFNTLTAGNVATDPTATTPGPSGYYILNGTAADYQIMTVDAAHGNSLQIKSGNGYIGAPANNTHSHFVIKPFTAVTPSAGNNFIVGSIQFYTGPSTGAGKMQFAVYDANGGIVGITYDYATKKIGGMGKLQPVAAGQPAAFYTIGLSNTQTIPANTWVTVSFTYSITTGDFTWTMPEGTFTFNNANYTKIPGLNAPNQVAYGNTTALGNAVVNTSAFDNVSVQFANSSTLAVGETQLDLSKLSVSIYPNPTSDILNIKSDSKINKVEIFDMSGRNMKVSLKGNMVDVKHLPVGNYIINIETKEGKTSEKFIKK